MTSKKKGLGKKVALGVGTAIITLGFWASQAFYNVQEVVDGDTFVTSEGQYVRFSKIDAPEVEYCLGSESKKELERLVLNKKVFIKVDFIEKDRNRLIADVYTVNGNVQEGMLKKGLATLRGGKEQKVLSNASDYARSKSLGVCSDKCTQSVNTVNPKCNIKGNARGGEKYYRYPGCRQYGTTLVQLHLGESWFCSPVEASKFGFVKGSDCD